MSQDTRKDKRAKIVSLNVRYKSATVDEFIENHSHDVSRGGVFVKTPTPFAPGTLLKFEIRLAGDKSVIAGVGRVVWKREPTNSAPDRPAGMGVKFIKVDDSSRQVIDKLIDSKADAGSAFLSEPEQPDAVSAPPPAAAAGSPAPARSMGKMTMIGTPPPALLGGSGASAIATATGSPAPAPATPAAATAAAKPFSKKGTMIGVPLPSGEIPAARDPLGSSPSFPKDDLDPAREPTVVKQASEILNEALAQTGGTIDDMGEALFANLERKDDKTEEPKKVEAAPSSEQKSSSAPPLAEIMNAVVQRESEMPPAAKATPLVPEAKKSDPKVDEKADVKADAKKSDPPAAAADKPDDTETEVKKKSEPPPVSVAPASKTLESKKPVVVAAKPAAAQPTPANDEGKGSNTMMWAVAVGILAILSYVVYTKYNAPDETPKPKDNGAMTSAVTPPAPPTQQVAPVPTPAVTEMPKPTASVSAPASATAAPSASTSARATATVGVAVPPPPVPVVVKPPQQPVVPQVALPSPPPSPPRSPTPKATAEAPPPPPPPSPTGAMDLK